MWRRGGWRVAVRLDRVAALREPLAGLVVTELEHRLLEWLAGWDVGTVAVVVGVLHRARAAEPLADLDHPWAIGL
jgi:hypothetical protein